MAGVGGGGGEKELDCLLKRKECPLYSAEVVLVKVSWGSGRGGWWGEGGEMGWQGWGGGGGEGAGLSAEAQGVSTVHR